MLSKNLCACRTFVLFVLALSLSGCALSSLSPLASRTAAFSTAAAASVTQTNNAYQLVNQAYLDSQTATLVANYQTTPFDPSKLKPYLPEKDLEVRTQVLNALMQYATLLAEVSGNQPITDLETQTAAAGSALLKLQPSDFSGFKVSSTEQNLATTALTTIGGVLIQRQRSRSLPEILDKMNPPIQNICTVLESDIGTLGKPGLASALHRDYDDQIAAEEKFIRDNSASLTPQEKRTEIETLPKLVQAQSQSDQLLAATSKSLASLAATHAALTATKKQKNAPAFRLELDKLVQDAQTINGFYSSLSSK